MEFRLLGETGVKVAVLGLGTLTFGRETDEEMSFAILNHYTEAGGNFIDTADIYAKGQSETIIGRWFKQRGHHDDLIISTKVGLKSGKAPNDIGLTRYHILRSLHTSLERLGVDSIDLYQAHVWDNLTPIEETLQVFDELVKQGKIRYVGVSNFCGWQLMKTAMTSDMNRYTRIASIQSQYNLLERGIEWEVLPVAAAERVGVLVWSPLGGGWLTGKYQRGAKPDSASRLGQDKAIGVDRWERRATERTWRILDTVSKVSGERNVPMSQVALNWSIYDPIVSSSIIGVRSLAQLVENLKSLDWTLSAYEMQLLDDSSCPGMPHPYDFIQDNARR